MCWVGRVSVSVLVFSVSGRVQNLGFSFQFVRNAKTAEEKLTPKQVASRSQPPLQPPPEKPEQILSSRRRIHWFPAQPQAVSPSHDIMDVRVADCLEIDKVELLCL